MFVFIENFFLLQFSYLCYEVWFSQIIIEFKSYINNNSLNEKILIFEIAQIGYFFFL